MRVATGTAVALCVAAWSALTFAQPQPRPFGDIVVPPETDPVFNEWLDTEYIEATKPITFAARLDGTLWIADEPVSDGVWIVREDGSLWPRGDGAVSDGFWKIDVDGDVVLQ